MDKDKFYREYIRIENSMAILKREYADKVVSQSNYLNALEEHYKLLHDLTAEYIKAFKAEKAIKNKKAIELWEVD